ncbi:hypothetical protein [Lacticaseibacillus camelliae]|uniref:Uncharacterized protein n=1 Tax=Lacticaseibacillus camelliae DSM 22697 = JCM 13995 TaxID=1423730 RepID=A0A0R2FDI8_9LACO|nr:hypothetical protein [Lacticaseibacillus camelliae]KRN25371.1 hypothetical protein FC75_GL000641 [Lacticaseibacillus camelliae DSM 22697 = JCM 13995]
MKNGAPQHEYDWAMYLQSVTLGQDHRLAAHADALKVSSLVLSSRKQLATQAQKLVLDSMAKQKLITDPIRKRGIYVSLYAGKTLILDSKENNFNQFLADE